MDKSFNKSLDHLEEVQRIWKEYNKDLTGQDNIGGNIFEAIQKYRPDWQTEILFIMYNAGYEAAKQN